MFWQLPKVTKEGLPIVAVGEGCRHMERHDEPRTFPYFNPLKYFFFYVQTVLSLVSGGPFMLTAMTFWCDHSNLWQLLFFQAWQDVPAQGALVPFSGKWHLETTIWELGCLLLLSYHCFQIFSVNITRKYQIFRQWKINHELILIFSIWSKNNGILF